MDQLKRNHVDIEKWKVRISSEVCKECLAKVENINGSQLVTGTIFESLLDYNAE